MHVLSCIWLSEVAWTIAHETPLSMGFSRQECWSGLPFPPLGDLSDPGTKPKSPAVAGGFFITSAPWEALTWVTLFKTLSTSPKPQGRYYPHLKNAKPGAFQWLPVTGKQDLNPDQQILPLVWEFVHCRGGLWSRWFRNCSWPLKARPGGPRRGRDGQGHSRGPSEGCRRPLQQKWQLRPPAWAWRKPRRKTSCIRHVIYGGDNPLTSPWPDRQKTHSFDKHQKDVQTKLLTVLHFDCSCTVGVCSLSPAYLFLSYSFLKHLVHLQ